MDIQKLNLMTATARPKTKAETTESHKETRKKIPVSCGFVLFCGFSPKRRANKIGYLAFGSLRRSILSTCLGLAFAAAAAGQTPPVVPVQQATPPPQQQATPVPNPQASPGQVVGNATGNPPTALPEEPPPVAPNFEAPMRPLPDANRVGVDNANQLPLTLEDAITRALQNNNNIDATRDVVKQAEFSLRGARGVYDPVITSQNYFESRSTPTASTIGGATNGVVTQKTLFSTTALNGFTPFYGGNYSAGFTSSRTNTSNRNATLNPQYPTSFTATYTQPLFRNLFFDNNRRQIEIAKKNLSLNDAQFRQMAIDVISQVEQAYWNLVFALRNLQVQIDAVKQARAQLESNQRLVEKGVLAPIDVVAASAQITTFEQNVYTAQQDVTTAENTLKTLMLPDRTSDVWNRPITPVSPVSLDPPRVGVEVAVAEALKNRPEIAQLQVNADINQIDQRYYRDQTKPEINLVGTYTTAGLAGTPNPNSNGGANVPDVLRGGYFTSLGNLAAQRYPTYNVGIQISLPLKNTVAKANLGRSLAEGDQIKNQREQAEQTIEAEVRNAVQALKSAEARLNAASASRAASEQLYESEERQFRAGTTTLYLVLQRQTELLAARGRELQAQTDLNKAISEFQHATGNTLSANNVTVK